jgi:hypothetical protein
VEQNETGLAALSALTGLTGLAALTTMCLGSIVVVGRNTVILELDEFIREINVGNIYFTVIFFKCVGFN